MRSSTLVLLFLAALAVLALTATSVDASKASSLESPSPALAARRFSGVNRLRAEMGKPKAAKKSTNKKKSSPLGKKTNTSSKRQGQPTGQNRVEAGVKGQSSSSSKKTTAPKTTAPKTTAPKTAGTGPKVGSGTIKYTYSQSSGVWTWPDGKTVRGYSGRAGGLNNPAKQNVRAPCQGGAQCDRVDAGPIPRGQYTVSFVTASGHKRGPWTIGLAPSPNNNMMGRDGFLVHGANRRDTATNKVSSTGCIILPPGERAKMKRGAILTVTN